ncbi:hypothetical protein ABPG72_012819 [Tetrahymena utriculariae]
MSLIKIIFKYLKYYSKAFLSKNNQIKQQILALLIDSLMKKNFVQLLIFLLYLFIAFAQIPQQNACGIPGCMSCLQNISVCLICENNLTYNRSIQICERRQDQLPSTYFDLSSTNNNLSYCHPSCKSCSGSSAQNCIECWDGYRPVTDSENQFIQCVSCGISNCQRCNKLNICLKCQSGYFLDLTSNACRKCQVQDCLDCSLGAESCNKCIAPLVFNQTSKACQSNNNNCNYGEYQLPSGKCNQCHQACKSCFDSGDYSCYECKQGYFFNLQNICISCNSNCLCSEFPQNCKFCLQNLNLLANRCVSQCGKGFYAENKVCKPCPPQCADCLNQNFCTSCLDNSQYILLSNSCVLRCNESQYVQMALDDQQRWLNMQYNQINTSSLTCNQCSPSCKTCILQSNRCTSCLQGYILFQNKCIKNCPQGYYQSFGENQQPICQKCQYPCNECTSSNFCLSCQSGFSLWQNGVCGYDYQVVGQCSIDQYQFQSMCFDQCPQGSLVVGRRCFCQNGCSQCTYISGSNSISCTKCLYRYFYTYKEQCIATCPPLAFIQETPTKACTNFCSNGTQVRQILLKGRFCSDNCDSNISNTQGICNQIDCDKGQYFDNNKYQNQLKLNQNIKNLQQFCTPCHPACLTCTGPSQYECIVCKQQLFITPGPLETCPLGCTNKTQSVLVQALPNSQTKQVTCVQCQNGYVPQNVTNNNNILQIVCVQNIECLKDQTKLVVQNSQNSYGYVCKQQIVCPSYTQPNYNTGQCDLISTFFTFQLDNNKQIKQKYTYQDTLNYQFQSTINTMLIINSVYLNDNKICCGDQKVSTYDFNSQILPSNYASIQYNNKLSLNLQIGNMNFVLVQNFQILQIINGIFSISPLRGFVDSDQFTIQISDFLLDGLQFEDYTLKYQIFMQYFQNDCLNYQNFTLFLFDQNYLQQNQVPLSLLFQFKFPYVYCAQQTRVYLKVYNDLISTITYVDINLDIFQQQQFQISPILNYTVQTLKIPQDSQSQQWKAIALVQKLILNNIIQPVDLDTTNIQNLNLLKLLSNTPYFQMNCQNACTSNGICINDTNSYFDRCNCSQDFKGESCQWKIDDLEYLSLQFDELMGNYVSEFGLIIQNRDFDSNRFLTALNTLLYIVSFRDYFDQKSQIRLLNFIQILNSSDIYLCLSIYKTKASFSQLVSASEILLNIFDKVYDLLKKLRIQNQNISEQIISNIKSVLSCIRQSLNLKDQSYYQFAQTSITVSINLLEEKNIKPPIIRAKDQSYQIKLSDPLLNQYGDQDISVQVLAFPFIQEFQIQDPSNIAIASSKIIDIGLFQTKKNISEQLKITFPIQINILSYAYLFNISPEQQSQIFLTACGYQSQSQDQNYKIDNNQTSASMQNIICLSKNNQRIEAFFGNNFNIPNNNNDKNKKDGKDNDKNQIGKPKCILTLVNSIIIFGVGSMASFIVFKVKQLETTQISDGQISGLKEEDKNKNVDKKDLPSIPENPIIQEGVNIIALGEILEENKIQKKRKSKILTLPINSIELFRRNQEQNNLSQLQNQRIEIILSQENIMRQENQNPVDFRQQSFINLNASNMIQNQVRQQKNENKDINIIQIEEQKEKCSSETDTLPKGIPIENPQIKVNRIKQGEEDNVNNNKSISDYFSIKSFTKYLQNTPAHVRIFIFFSQAALIQFMVISFFLKVNFLNCKQKEKLDSESFVLTILQSLALKNLTQYLFPIIYLLLSKIEIYLRQTNSFFYKNIVKGLYINIINILIVCAINIVANNLGSSQVSEFLIIYFITVIIDMIVLDLVILFIQKKINSCKLIEDSLILKNYNFKLEA